MEPKQPHFKGKDALHHVVEVLTGGKITSSEIHGAETPGSFFAGCDAAKETAIFLVLVGIVCHFFDFTPDQRMFILYSLSLGLIFWKFGRAAWLANSRFERLHRVAQEEQRELIEQRPQERDELMALYRAKGFEGKLLGDVVDVLMADSDRALREMLKEELGFRLEENEHPLIQGLGAALGCLFAAFFAWLGYRFFREGGFIVASSFIVALSALLPARFEKSHVLRSIIWNLALAIFAILSTYYLMRYFIE